MRYINYYKNCLLSENQISGKSVNFGDKKSTKVIFIIIKD